MKSINKLFVVLIGVVSFVITSCSDDDYTAGNPTNKDNLAVYFEPVDNPVRLAPDDLSFTLSISRIKTDTAIVVPLTVSDLYTNIFTVPATVKFENGEKTKIITIEASEQMKLFENYSLIVVIDPAFTYPYASANVYPRVNLQVVKEDYKPYATGTYYSSFWGEDENTPLSNSVKMEYSELLDNYRLDNCWGSKTGDVVFTWDGLQTVEFVEESIETGMADGNDPVTALAADDPSYDETTKTFTFPFEWTLNDGSSYGVTNDTYVIENLIQ